MKTNVWCMLVVVAGALVIQGCAQTGDVRSESTSVASPAPAVATSAQNSSAAIPEDAHGKPVIAINSKDDFEAVAAAIRQQMQAGGRFAFVTPDGRSKVNSDLNDMAALFTQYGTVDKMAPAAQSRLTSDQNAVNEVLARYDSNRRICHNEMPVGSHIPKRVCRTLGQIQEGSHNAQQAMRRSQMRPSRDVGVPGH